MAIQTTPRSARYIQSNRAAASVAKPFVSTPISEERANESRNAPTAQPAGVPADSPFYDPAKRILTPAPLDLDTKADAYDHFYEAKTPDDLSQRLQSLSLPANVHSQLVDAKQSTMPVPSATEKVVEAIQKLASMDPRIRQIGESHPNILRAFLSAGEESQ